MNLNRPLRFKTAPPGRACDFEVISAHYRFSKRQQVWHVPDLNPDLEVACPVSNLDLEVALSAYGQHAYGQQFTAHLRKVQLNCLEEVSSEAGARLYEDFTFDTSIHRR